MGYIAPSGQKPRPVKPPWGCSVFYLALLAGIFALGLWPEVQLLLKIVLVSLAGTWSVRLFRQQNRWLAVGVLAGGGLMLVSSALDWAYLTQVQPLPAALVQGLERLTDIKGASTALFYLGLGLPGLVHWRQVAMQPLPLQEQHRKTWAMLWVVMCGFYVVMGWGDLWSLGRWFWGF